MNKYLSLISFLFFSPIAMAAVQSDGMVQIELTESTLKASVKEGFHLNEKAPNAVVIDSKVYKPAKLDRRAAEFTNLPKTFKDGHAALYVCDDAVTFCEPHLLNLSAGKDAAKMQKAAALYPGRGKTNENGFIQDDFQKAIDLAQSKSKLVIADFGARWCPGCIRMEKEVFVTSDFKKATKGMVKVKIDVDRFENQVLTEKFNVKSIPALIVMTSDQAEIARIVDYQPESVWKPFLKEVAQDQTPIIRLLDQKEKSPDHLKKLGHRLLEARQFKEAEKYLSQVSPAPDELNEAKVDAAKADFSDNPSKKAAYVQVLKNAIKSEPSSSRSLAWRTELVGLLEDKNEIKGIRLEGVAAADEMLKDDKKLLEAVRSDLVGEFTGLESLFVASTAAELVDASGAEDAEIKAAWEKAVEAGRKLKIPPQKSGPALRYLIVLTEAKSYPEADRQAAAILKIDPANADVQRRRVKVLVELGKFDEAIKLGEKSIKNSYGRNEFWIAESLAKAYAGAKQNVQAMALLDRYLTRGDIEWGNMKSSRKNMEELRQKLANAKE